MLPASELSNSANNHFKVVYFWAPWASPCTEMTAILESKVKAFPAFSFISVLVDEEDGTALTEEYKIEAVPTILFIKDKKELERIEGFHPDKLQACLHQYQEKDKGTLSSMAADTSKTQTATNHPTPPPLGSTEKTVSQLSPEQCKRLDTLVRSAPVMLFIKGSPSHPQCGFTRQLITLLAPFGIPYSYFDIISDETVRSDMKLYSDWPTFPQIYVQGQFVGGLDILKGMIESSEWQELTRGLSK